MGFDRVGHNPRRRRGEGGRNGVRGGAVFVFPHNDLSRGGEGEMSGRAIWSRDRDRPHPWWTCAKNRNTQGILETQTRSTSRTSRTKRKRESAGSERSCNEAEHDRFSAGWGGVSASVSCSYMYQHPTNKGGCWFMRAPAVITRLSAAAVASQHLS